MVQNDHLNKILNEHNALYSIQRIIKTTYSTILYVQKIRLECLPSIFFRMTFHLQVVLVENSTIIMLS